MTSDSWSDEVDAILGGDLTAALALATTAGGAVCMAVAPLGLRDRHNMTVSFLTSLGVAKKLKRIEVEPRVALAYHSRQHGKATQPGFVLVQGTARADFNASQASIDHMIEQAESFLGSADLRPRRWWRWWLHEYATVRVPVIVSVDQISVWRGGETTLTSWTRPGTSSTTPLLPQLSHHQPATRRSPAKVDARAAARRVSRLRHQLLTFQDDSGAPVIVPVQIRRDSQVDIQLASNDGLLPRGRRRAGLLAHEYRPRLIGIKTRQLTGWLQADDANNAHFIPGSESGYSAPANKIILLLANGLLAKQGFRKAVKSGDITRLPVPFEHSKSPWRISTTVRTRARKRKRHSSDFESPRSP